jgi:4'-phosphopantetheinyl transferase
VEASRTRVWVEIPAVWTEPSSRPQLADDVVDVWRVDLAGTTDLVADLLSPDEQERAARFRQDVHRRRWKHARGVLRALVGVYLGDDPQTLRFATGPYGKPEVEPPSRLRFNVSHSEEVALFAFTFHRAVGVDVEIGDRLFDAEALARQVLGDEDARRIGQLIPPDRQREFLRLWTRYEAELKCRGLGVGADRSGREDEPVWISDLDLGPDAAAAVAAEGAATPILRLWRGDVRAVLRATR